MARSEILSAISALKISMTSQFVPFSQSRNKASKHRSLNWTVNIYVGGERIIACDYGAGSGHCKIDPKLERDTVAYVEAIKLQCENGKARGKDISPDIADVVASLVIDAGAIDSPTYEDFADEMGMDKDSRAGEAMYKACIETGLALRKALGEDGLSKLREACQDY